MDRIDTETKAVDLFGAGKHGFKDGDLPIGVIPTDFDAEWCNAVQEELMSVIEGAGVVPDAAVRSQVFKAIKRMTGGNVTTVNAANSPFALTADHAGLVIVDATAGNASATLPAVNALAGPIKFTFARLDASANTATVTRAGADTFIGGATSFTLVGQGSQRDVRGDASSKWAASFDFGGPNQSYGANGYQKFTGGIILQWGQTAISSAGTAVTFPIAFPATCVLVVPSIFDSAPASRVVTIVNASVSPTGFQAATNVSGSGYWFALGK